MKVLICDLLATVSMAAFCYSNFRKTKTGITAVYIISNICDCIMYIIMGGMTGLANSSASLFKNAAFSKFDSVRATIFFSGVRVLFLCFGYEGILTFLFIMTEIAITYIMFKGTVQQMRVLTALRQLVWVVYDVRTTTLLVATTTFVGFIFCTAAVFKNRNETAEA